MSLHRRAAKRDAAEPAIVSALEALGCVVWRVSGKGLPDLIVLRAGKKWLADVKGPKEKPTPAQEKAWEEAATKGRCSVFILRTPEDAQKMLNNALQPWEPPMTTAQIKNGVKMIEETRKSRGVCSFCGHVRDAHGRRGCTKAHPRGGKCRCAGDTIPRTGDASKARARGMERLTHRETCRFNDCETGERCGVLAVTSGGMSVPRNGRDAKKACGCLRSLGRCEHSGNYTPPRSTPVDAAKEAEATFAPAERVELADPCACRLGVLCSYHKKCP